MDPDEIEPASTGNPAGRNLPDANTTSPDGASRMVTAIATTIINASMITHSVSIAAIVTICVLAVALAPGVSRFAVRRTAADLEDAFHSSAFSTAYLVEGTDRRLDVIRSEAAERWSRKQGL